MAKQQLPKIVTPKGVAIYPKLTAPDEFKGEKNYKTGLLLDPSDAGVPEFIAKVQEAAQESFDEWEAEAKKEMASATGAKKAKLKKAMEEMELHTPLAPEYDDEGEETGNFILNVKMKAEGVTQAGKAWDRRCPLFDSRGNDVTKTTPMLWGGSVLKLQVTLVPFAMTGTSRAGVSGRLEAVQIVTLAAGGADGSAFGVEEDGYVAEEDDTTARFDEEVADDVSDDEDF